MRVDFKKLMDVAEESVVLLEANWQDTRKESLWHSFTACHNSISGSPRSH